MKAASKEKNIREKEEVEAKEKDLSELIRKQHLKILIGRDSSPIQLQDAIEGKRNI
jgi:dynactin complex subunit